MSLMRFRPAFCSISAAAAGDGGAADGGGGLSKLFAAALGGVNSRDGQIVGSCDEQC